MAVGVQEHTVVCRIPTPKTAPDEMMAVPSCQASDVLAADWASTVWLLPKMQQLPPTSKWVGQVEG